MKEDNRGGKERERIEIFGCIKIVGFVWIYFFLGMVCVGSEGRVKDNF